jgi:cytochrome c oxidase cbb3-type subunit 1
MRALGGLLYLSGLLLMIFNVWKTIRGDVREEIPMGYEQSAAPALNTAE